MERKKALVLGLGLQGRAALYDLARNPRISHIIAADSSPNLNESLERFPKDKVSGRLVDATDENAVSALIGEVDIVIEALPSSISVPIGAMAARLRKSLVSSIYYVSPAERDPQRVRMMKERASAIDAKAKAGGVVILCEFGLDPGIDLAMGAKALSELDEVREFYSYGSGIPTPEAASNPLKYKFSWSPIGVMKAYKRPARIISKGRPIDIADTEIFAGENIHVLDIPEMGGPIEWYCNGDAVRYAEEFGIRDTVAEMARYTGRYPGHCAFWEIMAKAGFLDATPIKVGNADVAPVEFITALLLSQAQFSYTAAEQDIAMVRVDVRGVKNKKSKRIVYQLVDKRDLKTGFTAMQRTVGFTLALGAELILDNRLPGKGLLGPLDVPFDLLVEGLEKRGIRIAREESV